MKVHVKQKRVGKRNADNRDRVCDPKDCGPSVDSQSKKTVKSDEEVAAVPAADAKRQRKEDPLERSQLSPAGKKLCSHPEREYGPDAVTNEL
jgi:hypothetical protein